MTANVPNLLDETRDQLLGVKAFIQRVLYAWPTALALLFVGGGACAAYLLLRRPAFRSETVLLYSEGARLGEDNERLEPARSVSARLKEILMSRASLDGVVADLNLYPELRQARGTVDAAEELKKHVEFKAPGGDTFSIAFTGTSARQAQAVTARLADVVIGHDSQLRKKQATAVRDFLESEKRSTEDELKDAELALASFLAAHPRFALDATPLATGAAVRASLGAPARSQPTSGARSGLSSALAHLSSMVAEGSALSDGAESRAGGDAMAEQMRARAALAAARANLTELAARFTPMHPDVRAAQAEVERAMARVAAADGAAAARPAAVVPPLPPARGAAVPRPSAPEAPRSERDVVALETQWVSLTRRATETRQHQDQVEAALFKANIAASSEKGDGVQMAVIDPAFLPESAVPPGRAAIAGIFAAGSLLLAAVGAALRALLDDRVYDERDLRQLGPVLALVPRGESA